MVDVWSLVGQNCANMSRQFLSDKHSDVLEGAIPKPI